MRFIVNEPKVEKFKIITLFIFHSFNFIASTWSESIAFIIRFIYVKPQKLDIILKRIEYDLSWASTVKMILLMYNTQYFDFSFQ
jgi:hypothetical protein